ALHCNRRCNLAGAGNERLRHQARPVPWRDTRRRAGLPMRVAAPQFGYVGRQSHNRPAPGSCARMSQLLSLLVQFDGLCAQLATAIEASQTQLYAMLALVVVAAFFAFPPKDDPDQI